jgi:pyruvate decarboxylase
VGKSLLDEHHVLYGGCYAGANSLDKVREEVESADFVLYVGALKSDFNSGSFSVNIDPKIVIELHSFTTNVGYASYPTTDIRHILPKLIPAFKSVTSSSGDKKTHGDSLADKQKAGEAEVKAEPDSDAIKHAWFWPKMGEWFKDGGQ